MSTLLINKTDSVFGKVNEEQNHGKLKAYKQYPTNILAFVVIFEDIMQDLPATDNTGLKNNSKVC